MPIVQKRCSKRLDRGNKTFAVTLALFYLHSPHVTGKVKLASEKGEAGDCWHVQSEYCYGCNRFTLRHSHVQCLCSFVWLSAVKLTVYRGLD